MEKEQFAVSESGESQSSSGSQTLSEGEEMTAALDKVYGDHGRNLFENVSAVQGGGNVGHDEETPRDGEEEEEEGEEDEKVNRHIS